MYTVRPVGRGNLAFASLTIRTENVAWKRDSLLAGFYFNGALLSRFRAT